MPDAVLKNGWHMRRFDEMAVIVNDRIDDPAESEVDRYVGLEHLDSDSLTIRRWGSRDDVEATKLRFRTGDIIFGRRRAYQRKLAVADFDGICSAHAMVLRARPEVVLPSFLPFLMQSDLFMERAKEISVGSLSPTINWKALAKEQFILPPLEQQRRIAAMAYSWSALLERQREVEIWTEKVRRAHLVQVFRPHRGVRDTFPAHWSVAKAATVGDIQLGQQRHPKYIHGTNVRPYLRVANVFDGWISFDDLLEMHFPEREISKFELVVGDILLNEGQSTELVGRSAIYRGEIPGCCFQKTLLRFRCGENLLPDFAQAFFQHCLYTGQFARIVVQTTSMAHLTAVRFKEFKIPVPPLREQRQLGEHLSELNVAVSSIRERRAVGAVVARSLLGRMLEGCGV